MRAAPLGVVGVVFGLGCVVGCGSRSTRPRHPVEEPSTQEAPTAAPERETLAATPWPDYPAAESSVALAPFASRADLLSWLARSGALSDPEAQAAQTAIGNMWGGSSGDSFGAGLGLSGSGEGGGGRESVTHTQHAGVDEGGIVKVHGDHLVVLRRGRLFTLRISDLAVTGQIDVYPPQTDPAGTWYDELLVSGDTAVVVGYSYARGGTEIALFDIAADGHMRGRATYHLRSADYYSARDYASRLVGDKLVFYAPVPARGTVREPLAWMPALRKWRPGARVDEFAAILDATAIDRPLWDDDTATLHTVTVCDLGKRDMTCKARGVMGPPGRVFYVSPRAVYVWTTPWTTPWRSEKVARSIVYRLPLDESTAATAVRARGAPTDAFSFLESEGVLTVLVRADANGDAMFRAEQPASPGASIALLRAPLSAFSRQVRELRGSAYVGLPAVTDEGVLQNRFVGAHVLYGFGTTWGRPMDAPDARVVAYAVAGGEPPVRLALGHGVDRIEALGDDAVVVGADREDLQISGIALGAAGGPRASGRWVHRDAAQGETRSHGFFYKRAGERAGVFGLPIRAGGEPGWKQLGEAPAAVLFVENDALRFRDLGSLDARAAQRDDRCKASCVDWYGNARPLFLGGRVFALLGYEIVEGRVAGGRVVEVRRGTFAPGDNDLTAR
jgi:hypothetical protein